MERLNAEPLNMRLCSENDHMRPPSYVTAYHAVTSSMPCPSCPPSLSHWQMRLDLQRQTDLQWFTHAWHETSLNRHCTKRKDRPVTKQGAGIESIMDLHREDVEAWEADGSYSKQS